MQNCKWELLGIFGALLVTWVINHRNAFTRSRISEEQIAYVDYMLNK